jgi:hypothetical protein
MGGENNGQYAGQRLEIRLEKIICQNKKGL